MWRAKLVVAVSLLVTTVAWGQNATGGKKAGEAARSPAEKKLLENPNDAQAMSGYLGEVLSTVSRLMQSDPAAARAKLDAMETFIAELKVDQPAAKARLAGMQRTAQGYRDRIEVQNISLAELEKKLLENPNDVTAIKNYTTKAQGEIAPLARTEPDVAEQKLKTARDLLTKARETATTSAAKVQLATSNSALSFLDRSIETGRLSLAEVGKMLTDSPNNTTALMDFYSKLTLEVSPLLRAKPDEAAKKIDEAREVFRKVEETATNQGVKSMIANYKRTIDSMARTVEAGKKLTEMIGKEAAPLTVEAWVNGSPLTDADLKGKVVFLDFWAVWCGPCIATFPHLREWNEKYGEKGLVMIGVTNYYSFKWDSEMDKAARSAEKVTPVEEQEMLVKFAESHDLKHRFALESGRALSEYYGVTGIPHVVVIDREGKIRLMKVGSGEENAKEIGGLLEELLGT